MSVGRVTHTKAQLTDGGMTLSNHNNCVTIGHTHIIMMALLLVYMFSSILE